MREWADFSIAEGEDGKRLVLTGPLVVSSVGRIDTALRARILRKFKAPIVVPAACGVEPGLIGAAILGLDFAREHQGG